MTILSILVLGMVVLLIWHEVRLGDLEREILSGRDKKS